MGEGRASRARRAAGRRRRDRHGAARRCDRGATQIRRQFLSDARLHRRYRERGALCWRVLHADPRCETRRPDRARSGRRGWRDHPRPPGIIAMTQHNPNPYETGLDKNAANYVPLSPIGFLLRSAAVYPNRIAVIHGEHRYTWNEALERCRRLASALAKRGIGRGDTVAVMAPNVPALFEAHFGVPMAGAILNALNIRLDSDTIAFIRKRGEAKDLITDGEFTPALRRFVAPPHGKALGIVT